MSKDDNTLTVSFENSIKLSDKIDISDEQWKKIVKLSKKYEKKVINIIESSLQTDDFILIEHEDRTTFNCNQGCLRVNVSDVNFADSIGVTEKYIGRRDPAEISRQIEWMGGSPFSVLQMRLT